jgi:hypothetical protein
MAALSDEVKQYIVQALACFDTPQTVSEAVHAEFGLKVPRQQVAKYDPTKAAGAQLSAKWRTLFNATREEWRRGATEVPIANRVFRLRALDRLAAKAERMKNMPLALQILEQAAKEVGDVYVNRRIEPVKPAGEEGPAKPSEDYRLPLQPDEDVPASPIL